MGLLHPELLVLAVPIGLAWWRTRGAGRVTLVLRAVVALLLLLALAGPYMVTGAEGRDLVILVDRSRSMPEESGARALELIALAEEEAREGDRLTVVAFGADAEVEHTARGGEPFAGFQRTVEADGTDLGGALESALELVELGRRGSILLVSDGEGNGRDPLPLARRAFARDVRIDVREMTRPGVADLAVERIDLPGDVAVGEPFQFNVWVRADRRVQADFRLQRGERVLSAGLRTFEPGLNRLVFRDVLSEPGVAEVEVALGAEDDRVPENNHGVGAVRASGAPAVLVLNHDGAEDSLVRVLRRARIPVAVAAPEGARLDPVGLSPFRAVVVENVEASRLGRGMRALRDFVLDRGGGLLMTGGQASFGVGGYYLSPLEEVLPVTMELRQEHRKLRVAMAIALDRSGSMSAPVAGGRTKMDLANLGTAAAIELLSPQDMVAVIAVDSAPHLVVELQPVQNASALVSKVKTIQSMGGGIFVEVALQAAIRQLEQSPLNRHVILFSDAADSEQPGGSVGMIERLHEEAGLTLSVIALGSEKDSDAQLLKDLAKAGGGDVHFTVDPADLPRLFALDTMKVARSTFIEEPTPVRGLPDLFGLGAMTATGFPTLPGYNLTYLRPDATAGAVTLDEYKAPAFAFMHQGLGRSAVFTGQIGGTFGGPVVAWEGFGELFVTAVRWLLGSEEPEAFFASVRREGKQAVIAVEVDPDAPLPPDTADLAAVLTGEDGRRTELVLERTGENLFEARHPLTAEGVTLGTVRVGRDAEGRERFVSLPPLVLPYSPEFERSPDPERGARLLRRLAQESGGEVGVSAAELFRGERRGEAWRLVTRELAILALVLMLVEIAGRRLSLWGSLRLPAPVRRAGRRVGGAAARLRQRVAGRPARRRVESPAPADTPATPGAVPQEAPTVPATGTAPPKPAPAPGAGVGSALSRARKAADKKLGR